MSEGVLLLEGQGTEKYTNVHMTQSTSAENILSEITFTNDLLLLLNFRV